MHSLSSVFSAFVSVPLTSVLVAVLVIVLLVLAGLIVFVVQLGTRLKYLTAPVYDHIVKEAEEKAEAILVEAREKSRSIRATAQEVAEKESAQRALEDETFRKEQEKRLEAITDHAAQLLTKQSEAVTKLSASLEESLRSEASVAQKKATDAGSALSETLAREANAFSEMVAALRPKLEATYADLTKNMQDTVTSELTKDVVEARKAVAAYRTKRLLALQEEIVSLVEEAARLALGKTLSLDEHRDIVLAALEEARKEGVFSKTT